MQVYIVLPVWNIAIQEAHSIVEDWLTKEAKANDKSTYFNGPITRGKGGYQAQGYKYRCQAQARQNEKKWRCWRKDTILTLLDYYLG